MLELDNTRRCDPCAAAPSAEATFECRAAKSGRHHCASHGTRQCEWVTALPHTLAFHWNERKVRGWGNFWPYLRTLHFAAALLGRRLLLEHNDSLPPCLSTYFFAIRESIFVAPGLQILWLRQSRVD